MQTNPHDDGLRWFLALAVPLFAGGVAWLVRHLSGREAQVVQLDLQRQQADTQRATVEEIRARVRREDDDAAFGRIKAVAQELRADVERVSKDREHWRERAEAAEARIVEMLEEQKTRHRMVNELSAHRLRWKLITQGVPLETVMSMPIEPIYEDAEGEPGEGS